MTSWFARMLLLQNFDKLEFCHFDAALRNALENPPANWYWCQASFVYPSIGHYCEHISGCEEGLGWRSSEWDRPWCQGGTRLDPNIPGMQHRSLHKFSAKGYPPVLGTIVLPEPAYEDEDLRWFTLRIDLESLSPQRSFRQGPAAPSGGAASASAAGAMPPPAAVPPGRGGKGGKRARKEFALKEEDPTRHEEQEPGQKLGSERAKRQHRQHSTNYKFRVFCEDEAQAALAAPPSEQSPLSAPAAPRSACLSVRSSHGLRTFSPEDCQWFALLRSSRGDGRAFRPCRLHPARAVTARMRGLSPCPSGGGCRLRAAPVCRRPAALGLGAPVDAGRAAAGGRGRRGALRPAGPGQREQLQRRALRRCSWLSPLESERAEDFAPAVQSHRRVRWAERVGVTHAAVPALKCGQWRPLWPVVRTRWRAFRPIAFDAPSSLCTCALREVRSQLEVSRWSAKFFSAPL